MTNLLAREQAIRLASQAEHRLAAEHQDPGTVAVAQVEAILALVASLGVIDSRLAGIERELPRIRGAINTGR